jgi:putrescine transport system ATP-binding protein
MTMANRIAVMSKGRVLQVGTPQQVYEYPANRFVADFIGNINLLDGQLLEPGHDHCVVQTELGPIHVAYGLSGSVNMPISVAIRPEKMHISKTAPAISRNVFKGIVKEMAYFGSYHTYVIQTSTGQLMKVMQANASRHDGQTITWGDEVFFECTPNAVVLLRDSA